MNGYELSECQVSGELLRLRPERLRRLGARDAPEPTRSARGIVHHSNCVALAMPTNLPVKLRGDGRSTGEHQDEQPFNTDLVI
jgi:hypothetical protein